VLLFDELGVLDDDASASSPRGRPPRRGEPAFATLEALAPGVRLAGAASGTIDDVACDLRGRRAGRRALRRAAPAHVDDDAAAAGWDGCFRDGDSASPSPTGPGPSGGEVALVADDRVFENEHVDEAGNAALAIGLLGASDRLAWYLPGPADADAAEAPTDRRAHARLGQPGAGARDRRHDRRGRLARAPVRPLVVERLPVQVPAGETSEDEHGCTPGERHEARRLDQLRLAAIGRNATTLRLPRCGRRRCGVDAAAAATRPRRGILPARLGARSRQATANRRTRRRALASRGRGGRLGAAATTGTTSSRGPPARPPEPDPDPNHDPDHPTGRRP
jgi:hypothetical protein